MRRYRFRRFQNGTRNLATLRRNSRSAIHVLVMLQLEDAKLLEKKAVGDKALVDVDELNRLFARVEPVLRHLRVLPGQDVGERSRDAFADPLLSVRGVDDWVEEQLNSDIDLRRDDGLPMVDAPGGDDREHDEANAALA